MAWKTGNSGSCTMTGTLACDIAFNTHMNMEAGMLGDLSLSAGAFGFGVGFNCHVFCVVGDVGNANDYSVHPRFDATLSIGEVGGGGASGTFDTSGGAGTYTITVPVEEWEEIIPLGGSLGTDHGVFDTPPASRLRVFQRTTVGGTATIEASLWGLSVSGTATTTGDEISSYIGSVSGGVSVSSTGIGGTLRARATGNVNGVPVGGSYSYSDGHAALSNGGGADVTMTFHDDVDFGRPWSASASAASSPPKVFSLTGAVNAVDVPYPDLITFLCPRYSGDPDPTFVGGATFSRSGTQVEYYESYSVNSDAVASESRGENTKAPVGVTLDSQWCRDHGESVTWTNEDDAGNTATFFFDNARTYIQGWSMPGLTLTQDAETVLDDCSSATGWTGATVAGGGLQPTAGTITRAFANPGFNFSGYAYLRIRGRCESGAATRTLSLGGKSWDLPLTSTTADVDIDLLDPKTGGADNDTTDTKWPLGNGDIDTSSGPLWGVSSVDTLSLSGLDAAHPDTIYSISLVRKDGTRVRKDSTTVSVLGEWAPRADQDMALYRAPRETSNGTVITDYCTRGIVADTDGRQSQEWHFTHVARTDSASAGITFYVMDCPTINNLADLIEQIPGWHAAINAPAADATDSMHNGHLNRNAPAYWLLGNGLYYLGDGLGFQSGVGLNLDSSDSPSLVARALATEVDWYPHCGDVFGIGPTAGATTGTIYLAASKVLRAQAHGVLLTEQDPDTGLDQGRATGRLVRLLDAGGDLCGADRSRSPEGDYRTRGEGLTGYTTVGDPPSTGASPGTVVAGGARGDDLVPDGAAVAGSPAGAARAAVLLRHAAVRRPGDVRPAARPGRRPGDPPRRRVEAVDGYWRRWQASTERERRGRTNTGG